MSQQTGARGRSGAFSLAPLLSSSRGGSAAPTLPHAPPRRPCAGTAAARGGRTRRVHRLPKRWPAPLGASRRVPGCGCDCPKASTGVPAVNFILTAAPRKVPAPRTAGECESLSALQVAEGRGGFGVRRKRGCSVKWKQEFLVLPQNIPHS